MLGRLIGRSSVTARTLPCPSIPLSLRLLDLLWQTPSNWYCWQRSGLEQRLLQYTVRCGESYRLKLFNEEVLVSVDLQLIEKILAPKRRLSGTPVCGTWPNEAAVQLKNRRVINDVSADQSRPAPNRNSSDESFERFCWSDNGSRESERERCESRSGGRRTRRREKEEEEDGDSKTEHSEFHLSSDRHGKTYGCLQETGRKASAVWKDWSCSMEEARFCRLFDIARFVDPSLPADDLLEKLLTYDEKEGLLLEDAPKGLISGGNYQRSRMKELCALEHSEGGGGGDGRWNSDSRGQSSERGGAASLAETEIRVELLQAEGGGGERFVRTPPSHSVNHLSMSCVDGAAATETRREVEKGMPTCPSDNLIVQKFSGGASRHVVSYPASATLTHCSPTKVAKGRSYFGAQEQSEEDISFDAFQNKLGARTVDLSKCFLKVVVVGSRISECNEETHKGSASSVRRFRVVQPVQTLASHLFGELFFGFQSPSLTLPPLSSAAGQSTFNCASLSDSEDAASPSESRRRRLETQDGHYVGNRKATTHWASLSCASSSSPSTDCFPPFAPSRNTHVDTPIRVLPRSTLPRLYSPLDAAHHHTADPLRRPPDFAHYRFGRPKQQHPYDGLYRNLQTLQDFLLCKVMYLPPWWRKVSFSAELRHVVPWNSLFGQLKDITHFLENKYRQRKAELIEAQLFSAEQLVGNCRDKGLLCVPEMDALIFAGLQRFKESYRKTGLDHVQSLTDRHAVALLLKGFKVNTHIVSNAICFALLELGRHPEVQAKVREEGLSRPADSADALASLPFLRNVVKETLRLHPVSPAIWRTNLQDVELKKGLTVKAGTRVLIPQFVLGRMAKYWSGYPVDRFVPERWQITEPSLPNVFFPFSQAERNWIAEESMELIIVTVLSAVIRSYPPWHVETKSHLTAERGLMMSLAVSNDLELIANPSAT